MISAPKRIALLASTALLFAACSASAAPAWTFSPDSPDSSGQPAASAAPSTAPSPAASQPTSGEVLGTLEVHAVDLGFQPNNLTVDNPGAYEVKLVNDGSITHDLTFADGTKISADSKQSASGTVTVPADGLSFICSIPGHADAGMKGTITVAGSTAGGATAGGDHGGPAPATDVQPDPNAPKYTLYDATAPEPLPGTTHDIDLVVQEKKMTVAEGFVVAVWTFNGTAPGPVIRVHLGDTIPSWNTVAGWATNLRAQITAAGYSPSSASGSGQRQAYAWFEQAVNNLHDDALNKVLEQLQVALGKSGRPLAPDQLLQVLFFDVYVP